MGKNEQLIRYIEYHDGAKVLADLGDALLVQSKASRVLEDSHHIVTFYLVSTIPATYHAVSAWLGY
jgi:hypothetical protein